MKEGRARWSLGSRKGRAGHRRGRGQSMVEFAIILPVFILALVGILDFGFMLYARMTVINAAREGAQYGSALATTAWPNMDSDVKGQVTTTATGLTTGNLQITVTCLVPTSLKTSPVTWSPTCSWTDTSLQGDAVQVRVTYPYQTFFPLFFGTKINFSTTVQMAINPPPAAS